MAREARPVGPVGSRLVGARDDDSKLKKGMVYNPVTEEWTYKDAQGEPASTPQVGGGGADGATVNRYERRMKEKAKAKARGKKKRK